MTSTMDITPFTPADAARRARLEMPMLYAWLKPNEAVQTAIAEHRAQWVWRTQPKPSLPKPNRLHMTLCHISPQGDAAVEGIRQALGELRMEEGFDLLLDWSGVWPHNGIAVVRPQPNAALDRLQQAVVRQLAPWLSGRHDDWAPHITIARKASGATAPTMPPVRWPVREFQFVRSWLKTRPVWHEVLASYPLQSFGRNASL